ncbi:hypothetical protein Q1695_010520 [Nippostrongylus brasiliensis]|nr:hypothetical protein Q1695_010520 [Nippostrongylus brasiliensis]
MSKRSKSLPPAMMSIEDAEQLYELLRGLSPREQAIIRPVLERDLEFQRREKARVRQLRSYVEMSEMQQHIGQVVRKTPGYPLMQSMSSDSMISLGSIRGRPTIAKPAQPPSGRVCYHCHVRLGFLFNAGTRCSKCSRLLCTTCRRGTHRSKWLCQSCYTERELRAASGEWVGSGDAGEVSEVLLSQMRRAAAEKEKQEEQKNSIVHVTVRAPMLSRRQLTLPTITTPSLLAVPSESDMKTMDRKVDLLDSVNVIGPTPPPSATPHGLHPREAVGSPAPRPATPMAPSSAAASPIPAPRSHVSSPMSARSPTSMIPRRTTGIPTDHLLRPVDSRQMSGRRQIPPADDGGSNSTEKSQPPVGHHWTSTTRAPSTVHPQQNQAVQERASQPPQIATGNETTKSHMSTSISDSGGWQHCHGKPSSIKRASQMKTSATNWEGMGQHRPSDDHSFRRSRFRSQDASSSMSSSKGDRLDVSSCDSRRSSGVSLPTRSVSQHTCLYKGDSLHPTSSRDSLSVASIGTEASIDGCAKSSVASQASCGPASCAGEVQLIISYDLRSETINVHVMQCRSLPHFGSHRPNPYIKVALITKDPTAAPVFKQKTIPRKADINPVFDQVLKFSRITKSEAEQYRFSVSVWHKDLLSQNSLIGETTIPLRNHDWDCTSPVWYRLEARSVGRPSRSMSLDNGNGCDTLLLQGVRFSETSPTPAAHRHALLVASAKLYFNEKQMERRRSETQRRDQIENQWNWSTTFPRQNLNDLHLKSLKLKIKQQTGPFGYRTLGQVVLNSYAHRRGRNPLQACSCVCCTTWMKLIDNNTVPIEAELPLTIVNR